MEQTIIEKPKTNDFLITLLSVLLLLSVIIAGFFAWKTQNLVKEIGTLNQKLVATTPIPTTIPEPQLEAVTLSNIKKGDLITSPVKIEGTISKNWTFESTFSIEILDSNRKSLNTLAVNVMFKDEQSQTGSFSTSIPFVTKLSNGYIVIHADNPSGLPQNDKSLEFPVKFNNDQVACTMDAKLCDDGTYVGRTGPKCEFAACPAAKPVTSP